MTAPSVDAGARVIDAGTYRVSIAPGLRHQFARMVEDVAPAHAYAVVSDSHVAPLYASDLLIALRAVGRASLHVVPAGEEHKTRASWSALTDELLALGHGRDTTVVALGGGVVGDLAGFVAATYLRGVPVVQCPTSLLAMIDASVGGKTGVDTAAGKNLVGAFHPPAAVLADVSVLATLPLAHRRAGLAEAIKHGVVADAAHFAELETALPEVLAGDEPLTRDVVARSVEIKVRVVSADAHERGLRKILNFGHTLGHALEQASGYTLLHGDCVAIGMALEARVAERMGIARAGTAAAIERVLRRAGLPVALPTTLDAERVLAATGQDKKRRAGTVEYALPVRPGVMAGADRGYGIPVDEALVREVLA